MLIYTYIFIISEKFYFVPRISNITFVKKEGIIIKKICIVTSSRAEYSLLKPLISKFASNNEIILNLVVTGMHLSRDFGFTYKLIEEDNLKINSKIDINIDSDTDLGVCRSMSLAITNFAEYFTNEKPNMVILLGDRFEIFAIASAATVCKIPISHLHGGESTEGAYDESFRHSITKMSYLHFASTEAYKKRVIQLGENPIRVFNVGAIGVENLKYLNALSINDLEEKLNLNLKSKYALLTFHVTTLDSDNSKNQALELIKVLDYFKDITFIITKGNCDSNGKVINNILEEYSIKNPNRIKFYNSLGSSLYLSLMKHASFVIGNSSSGIIETPSFKIPTINIGERQKGRVQSVSTLNCEANSSDIINCINTALSDEFKDKIKSIQNPYEKSNTCNIIYSTILNFLKNPINLQKKFFDIK